jgi:phosphoribosylanthranilate isomerase
MTRVKVCGVTRSDDAALAADLGASAIGMIFWPDSPRCLDVSRAREIVAAVPPFVSAVGVFVDQPIDEVAAIADAVGLSAIQLHGREDADRYAAVGRRLIKAVGVRDGTAEAEAMAVPACATVLLDAHDPVRRGGTGRAIDWTVAATIARRRPVILSGGLNPENVQTALRAVSPYAVDVSSGVESAPGRKDARKLRAFFAAVRTI